MLRENDLWKNIELGIYLSNEVCLSTRVSFTFNFIDADAIQISNYKLKADKTPVLYNADRNEPDRLTVM